MVPNIALVLLRHNHPSTRPMKKGVVHANIHRNAAIKYGINAAPTRQSKHVTTMNTRSNINFVLSSNFLYIDIRSSTIAVEEPNTKAPPVESVAASNDVNIKAPGSNSVIVSIIEGTAAP